MDRDDSPPDQRPAAEASRPANHEDDLSSSRLRGAIRDFAGNCEYRAECQITATGFWGNAQLFLAGAAAVSAAVAGASAFADHAIVAGALVVTASAFSAVLAAVKPGERAADHATHGNELNLLGEAALRLYEEAAPDELVRDAFVALVEKRDDVARQLRS